MKEIVRQLALQFAGAKLRGKKLEQMTAAYERLLEDNDRLNRLDLSQEEIAVNFSREADG